MPTITKYFKNGILFFIFSNFGQNRTHVRGDNGFTLSDIMLTVKKK